MLNLTLTLRSKSYTVYYHILVTGYTLLSEQDTSSHIKCMKHQQDSMYEETFGYVKIDQF